MTEVTQDVVVIGGGVVGSALATVLGKQGIHVTLIERDLSEPNRIVGELLQPGGVQHVQTLGLEDCFDDIDSPEIGGYAVFNGEEGVTLDYPLKKDGSKNKGRSFHHGRFIQNLRKAARKQKTVTIIEGTVTEILEENGRTVGVRYKQEHEEKKVIRSNLLFICDGIFSKFRKDYLSSKPSSDSCFVGFVISDIKLPYADRGHVFLCDNAPTLCYPISSTEARFLVDIPNPLPPNNGELGAFLKSSVASQLPDGVRQSVERGLETAQIRSMPCSRLHPEYYKQEGIMYLGDAWNMRHPITGGGMSIAFSDIVLIRDLFAEHYSSTDRNSVVKIKDAFFSKRIGRVAATNVLAEAIYRVMAGRGIMKAMQQAIFSYFKLGPSASATPVALLACLVTNPWLLVYHFFIVAAYGSVQVTMQSFLSIFTAIHILLSAASFFLPLLYHEHVLWK